MRKFRHIFLDLDRTLWDFEENSRQELESIFRKFKLQQLGISLPNEFIKIYKSINEECWSLYRLNKLSKEDLRNIRFLKTLEYFGISDQIIAEQIGQEYVNNSPKRTILIDGCHELLIYLKNKYQLHIITNGFEEVQVKKLSNSKLTPYFEKMITSESAGFKKPRKEIFNYALNLTGAKLSESVMIGDDLQTDIQGAVNIGMESIYFNPNRKNHSFNILADVETLLEIKSIL